MEIEKTKHPQTSEIYKLGPIPSTDPKTGKKRPDGGYMYLEFLSQGPSVNFTNMPDVITVPVGAKKSVRHPFVVRQPSNNHGVGHLTPVAR